MAKILVKRAGEIGQELELTRQTTAIGRDAGNDVVLVDPSVSRRHARIERSGDAFRIVDLDSGNGVVHRGKRVSELTLYPGCEVELGGFVLEFQDDAAREVPKLVLIAGGERESFPLPSGETVVGRSTAADVSVSDPLVSSSHFKILKRGSVFALVDLGSENGTYVNGVRVKETELKRGDQIGVAGITFYFAEDGVEPEPGSVEIVQPTLSQPAARAAEPSPAPASESAPPESPAPAKARSGPLASVPRPLLVGGGLLALFFFLIVLILLRSPEDGAEREFQEVFQANLSEEERERIEEYLTRAEEYRERENLELALEQYRKVLVLDPTHQTAQSETARLEERLEREAEARAEREREERERLAQVAELTERADGLVSERKFEEARELLQQAMELAPESEVLAAKMVASFVTEGDYFRRRSTSRARGAYQKALELDPESEAARRGLGRIDAGLRAAREQRQRVEELTEAGLAELRREEYRAAYASFSEVLKLDPGNERALEFREQAEKLLEEQVRPLYQEGVRLYNAEELAAAMAHFQRVLERHPDHADTRAFLSGIMGRVRSEAVDLYKRAYIYEGLGRLREALELYRETLALLPDPSEEYHQKASERIRELNRKLQ